MKPLIRLAPPPCESRTPLCSLCGVETVFDGLDKIVCTPCGAWWPSSRYWSSEGNWSDETAPACGARIRPWLGSIDYPNIADDVFACVLTAGHAPATGHRCGDWDWTDDDADGYRAVRSVNATHAARREAAQGAVKPS